ncbi:outer membrane protein OmpW [Saccharobesus litoralis]|uniref:Outer membrane protein OmpW n=1 Tax=Saccharobesus litoralis TaxID=2172099 RepID=A0A2S0VQH3_9ALTE|nr:OmpW family outer membrane protein [Saccharobesus litoralis]AWB66461.1 outer membrane protein OmpW [Saccharobesus litoralis]
MKKSLVCLALLAGVGSQSAIAYEAGDIIVRAGVTSVQPADNDAIIYAANSTVHLSQASPALTTSVDSNSQLGLNFAYMLTENWAIELLAATPFQHDIKVKSGATELKLGETKHLPPTLSAIYFFKNLTPSVTPYVGVGINYTVFFEDNFAANMQDDSIQVGGLNNTAIADLASTLGLPAGTQSVGLRAKDLKLDNSWGLAAQVGLDVAVNDDWHINASARYIDINTTAHFKATALEVAGQADVAVDPMVYTLSVGYTF